MPQLSKMNLLYNHLKPYAKESKISHQLSACIIKGKKIISKICCNTERSVCRGIDIGSLHAEANAILNYFGKDLTYSEKRGWCVLRS